jgi:carbamoyl-phosphate synthase large subunit
MKSVLLLSAGRRVSLLRAFEQEVRRRDPAAKVYAADMRPGLSSACGSAERALEVPAIRSPGFIPAVIAACEAHDIGLVVPTIDTELLPLAEARPQFEAKGIAVAISSAELVGACRDKRRTVELFKGLGINAPEIYADEAIRYPCFGKPLDGSRSVNVGVIRNAVEMQLARQREAKMIFTELVDRSTTDEYTVDLYYCRRGILRCTVPRKRIEVRDGEVSKGVTVRDDLFNYVNKHMGRMEGAVGCITFQIFRHREGGRYWAVELNPRFGGGFPLTYAAGGNYPGWLLDEHLLQQPVAYFDGWEENLLMLRYDSELFIHASAH